MPPTRAILTYHSLDASGSVISLRPEIFRQHIRSLVEQKIAVVSLEDILGPRQGEETQPAVALTFDDGFANFFHEACPLLHENHLPVTVFLISGYCGKTNDWSSQPPGLGGRALLGWSEIEELSRHGIEFGAHSVSHPDLTKLALAAATEEVLRSKKRLFRVLSGRRSQIEFPTVEVDGVDEVLLIAETARRGLDPLNP